MTTQVHHDHADPVPAGRQALAKRVLGRIEEEGIHPRPRLLFLAGNWGFWALGAASVLLGAAAIAAALFEIVNAGWGLRAALHHDIFSFVLKVMPVVWLLSLLLFIALGYLNIRRTKRGYRYPLSLIVLASVVAVNP